MISREVARPLSPSSSRSLSLAFRLEACPPQRPLPPLAESGPGRPCRQRSFVQHGNEARVHYPDADLQNDVIANEKGPAGRAGGAFLVSQFCLGDGRLFLAEPLARD